MRDLRSDRAHQSSIRQQVRSTSSPKDTKMELQVVASRMVSYSSSPSRTVLTLLAGIYKFYAVDITTLLDKPGFPVLVDGSFADNDPTR